MTIKTALITGGATGIGKATAKKLASQGVNVVISGRREELANDAITEIESVAIKGAKVKLCNGRNSYPANDCSGSL